MKAIVQTERLFTRKILVKDASFILALLNSPGWLEFIGERNIKTSKQAKAYIKSHLQQAYQDFDFGFYTILEKDSQLAVGIAGFIKRDSLPCVDFGYALLPQFVGKGYVNEIGLALLKLGKSTYHFDKVAAITEERNLKSRKVLEKLGFKDLGLRQVKDEQLLYFELEL